MLFSVFIYIIFTINLLRRFETTTFMVTALKCKVVKVNYLFEAY